MATSYPASLRFRKRCADELSVVKADREMSLAVMSIALAVASMMASSDAVSSFFLANPLILRAVVKLTIYDRSRRC